MITYIFYLQFFDKQYDIFILIVHLLILFVISFLEMFFRKNLYSNYYKLIIKNDLFNRGVIIFTWCIFAVISIFIAWLLGISIMGSKPPALPFKLTGIINTFHMTILPILFLLIYDFYFRSGKNNKHLVMFFLLYLIVESFVRHSRGVFFEGLMILFLFTALYHQKNLITLPRVIISGLLLSLLPLFTLIRDRLAVNKNAEIVSILADNYSFLLFSIFKRIFTQYINLHKYIYFDNELSFKGVQSYGSFSKYHTHYVNGLPETMVNSSGSSSLSDFYILGGYLGVILGVTLLIIFSYYFLNRVKILNPGQKVYLDFLLLDTLLASSILNLLLYRPDILIVHSILACLIYSISRRQTKQRDDYKVKSIYNKM